MSSASRLFGFTTVLATLAACGGELASSSSDRDGVVGSGGAVGSGDGGTGGATTSEADGGPHPMPTPSQCSQTPTATLPAIRMCVPEVVQFDDPLTLTVGVDETGFTCVACTATVDSTNTINITINGLPCGPGAVCNDNNAAVTCSIPPLISGPYTISFLHGPFQQSVQIDATNGGPTSCDLAPPQNIDGTSYPNACATDADCTLVFSGDPCSQCRCEGVPISASAGGQYQEDFDVQLAECPLEAGAQPLPCECPFLGRAACTNNTCQFVPANSGN